jgi:hypothetical protein
MRSGHVENSLADVYGKIVRFGEDFTEKASSLDDFNWVELSYGGATAYQTMAHFAIAAEAIAIGETDEGVFPAYELTTHLEHGSVGVNSALLVEHLDCYSRRVDDNEGLAEDCD